VFLSEKAVRKTQEERKGAEEKEEHGGGLYGSRFGEGGVRHLAKESVAAGERAVRELGGFGDFRKGREENFDAT